MIIPLVHLLIFFPVIVAAWNREQWKVVFLKHTNFLGSTAAAAAASNDNERRFHYIPETNNNSL